MSHECWSHFKRFGSLLGTEIALGVHFTQCAHTSSSAHAHHLPSSATKRNAALSSEQRQTFINKSCNYFILVHTTPINEKSIFLGRAVFFPRNLYLPRSTLSRVDLLRRGSNERRGEWQRSKLAPSRLAFFLFWRITRCQHEKVAATGVRWKRMQYETKIKILIEIWKFFGPSDTDRFGCHIFWPIDLWRVYFQSLLKFSCIIQI